MDKELGTQSPNVWEIVRGEKWNSRMDVFIAFFSIEYMNDQHFPDLMISGMPVKLWAAHPPPQDLAVQQQHLHLQVISYPRDTRNLQGLQQQKRNSNRKRRKVEKVAGDKNILVADYFSASLSDTRNIIKVTQQEAQSCSLSHPHIFIRLLFCASKRKTSSSNSAKSDLVYLYHLAFHSWWGLKIIGIYLPWYLFLCVLIWWCFSVSQTRHVI